MGPCAARSFGALFIRFICRTVDDVRAARAVGDDDMGWSENDANSPAARTFGALFIRFICRTVGGVRAARALGDDDMGWPENVANSPAARP
jgi:hypothetical protein